MTRDKFVDLLKNRREIEFTYNNINYGIDSMNRHNWYLFIMYKPDSDFEFKAYEDLLEHTINGQKIIDICEDFDVTYTC